MPRKIFFGKQIEGFLLDSNIILERGLPTYKFRHPIIQQYLTASRMVYLGDKNLFRINEFLFQAFSIENERQVGYFVLMLLYHQNLLQEPLKQFLSDLDTVDDQLQQANLSYEFAHAINLIGLQEQDMTELIAQLKGKLIKFLVQPIPLKRRIFLGQELVNSALIHAC